MFLVRSPMAGHSLAIGDLPDPVFSAGMVGPGVGIDPLPGAQTALAPVSGRLIKLHPHAFVVVTESGSGVLVHLGIDTVRMHGDGFTTHVAEQDQVQYGDKMVTWDPDHVARAGHSPMCAVVVLDCDVEGLQGRAIGTDVEAGQVLFSVSR